MFFATVAPPEVELFVRFGGKEEVIDFSEAANNYKIPFVSFFADCEHEIKPVTSGYRVVLTYNLVQKPNDEKISSPEFSSQTELLTDFLKSKESEFDYQPFAILFPKG